MKTSEFHKFKLVGGLWLACIVAVLNANAEQRFGSISTYSLYGDDAVLNVPKNIAALSNVVKVAAGHTHALALDAEGRVYAWGDNQYGQTSVPASVSAQSIVDISTAHFHNLALTSEGSVLAWGWNSNNQCDIPADMQDELHDIVKIAAGYDHSLALRADGTVFAWGGNQLKQCDVPPGLSDVVDIETGSSVNFAIKSDGTVVAWGDRSDADGLLAPPPGVSGVRSLSASKMHALSVLDNGTIQAWGDDYQGIISVPPGLSDVMQAAASLYMSAALKRDGTVAAWGRILEDVPEALASISNAVCISLSDKSLLVVIDETFTAELDPFEEALDAEGLKWETSSFAPWIVQTDVTYDSHSAVASGVVGENEESRLETVLDGPGVLSFAWRVSCDKKYARLEFRIDDELMETISGETDWRVVKMIVPAGTHRVSWVYKKDDEYAEGDDCGYLDNIMWTTNNAPARINTIAQLLDLKTWLHEHELVDGDDYEAALLSDPDGDGVSTWREYLLKTNPVKHDDPKFIVKIGFKGERPVITWTPNHADMRKYSIFGKESLSEAKWSFPTNQNTRFFKVSVELP